MKARADFLKRQKEYGKLLLRLTRKKEKEDPSKQNMKQVKT